MHNYVQPVNVLKQLGASFSKLKRPSLQYLKHFFFLRYKYLKKMPSFRAKSGYLLQELLGFPLCSAVWEAHMWRHFILN